MEIQIKFTQEELQTISKAMKLTHTHCDNKEDIVGRRKIIEGTDPFFSQDELSAISKSLAFGAIHTIDSDDEFEMTKLRKNLNIIASIPQTSTK